MTNSDICKYSPLYQDSDTSFLVNFGSKNLRRIRISLPSPPPLHLIDGFGLHPDDQKFKRLTIPPKLAALQKRLLLEFRNTSKITYGTNILKAFWDEIEEHRDLYVDEILFIKRWIWFMEYGYWCFIDGKPTFIPPLYFSYLNMHYMSLDSGSGYPDYHIRGLYRFLFRYYLETTTETFADIDTKTKIAYKVQDDNGNLVFRMVDVGRKLFVGSIEPKGRREGLTNEACHMITRRITSIRGADKLATIVSMDGDNAGTHFNGKLIPAWRKWPLWTKPAWEGQDKSGKIIFSSSDPTIEPLDTRLDFTDSAGDTANDGKFLVGALYDEQGKGKRTGSVQERWNINKQAMTLAMGRMIVGFCIHPSTVEKMTEGGKDYKDMCDLSNFYKRGNDGQTASGLAILFFPSDWCAETFIDAWGNPVLEKPTPRQIQAGFKERIGSRAFVRNRRVFLNNPSDPVSMEDLKSFVRKFPIDYDECWTGISGQLGLDNEKLREQIRILENKSESTPGELFWVDRIRMVVDFRETYSGGWIISKRPKSGTANRVSSMEDYSAYEQMDIVVNRPADPKFMIGADPANFSNKAESVHIGKGKTKKSSTAISVLDIDENEIIAFFKHRLATDEDAADEILKACVYWGGLVHTERNVPTVWSQFIKNRNGGFLDYNVEVKANGEMQRANEPGTYLNPTNKKDGFALLSNFITLYAHKQKIKEWMEEADEISSMEQLTGYDGLASILQCLFGAQSPYIQIMNKTFGEADDDYVSLGATSYNY